jgi:RecB family exonuclease
VKVGRTRSEEELLQLFGDDLSACGIEDDYQRGLYLDQGTKQLEAFLTGARLATAAEVLHTEEWFEVQIEGTKVIGRIDRVDREADGSISIVDYKTGKPRSQEDADESLQLSIYAMAARQKWGYDVGQVVFHNLEGNVPVFSRRTDFQLEQAKERVLTVARSIADGNFKPKPDFYCNYCAFRGLCPAKEKQVPNLGAAVAEGAPGN